MIDHVSIRVSNFAKALSFYTAALAPLGYVPQYVDEKAKSAGFGLKGEPRLWLAEGKAPATMHLALASPGRDSVAAFHAAALRAGGRDNGKPGLRPEYGATYYAAFVFDPDGNNLVAVTYATA